ncbi:MAG: hypothetical protein VX254_04080 [Planctomycetota bacterium]|nr:hypothetical protein [Planctomycetota bacterium]
MNRPRFYSQLAVVLVAGLLFAGGASSCRKKAPPVAAPAVPPGPPPATQDEAEELEALRKREQELETLLAGLKAAPGKSTIRQRLMGQLDSLDGRGMYSTVEEQLLRGEGGFRELLGFFRACDEERAKILTLTHDPHMVFPLLRLVARHPSPVAGFCQYMIRNTRDNPGSFIRREIYNFLPVFLNYHQGRYPELRQLLKEDIVYQLTKGGKYLYKMSLAMRDLQFKPPIGAMLPILYNLKEPAPHGLVMSHLAGRGEEGLEALVKFVEESGNSSHPSVSQVMVYIFKIAESGRKDLARQFLEHKDPAIRLTATFHYFRYPREPADFQRALDLLNSDVTVAQRILLLGYLKRKSPAIYTKLLEDPSRVTAPKARAKLEKEKAKEAANEK